MNTFIKKQRNAVNKAFLILGRANTRKETRIKTFISIVEIHNSINDYNLRNKDDLVAHELLRKIINKIEIQKNKLKLKIVFNESQFIYKIELETGEKINIVQKEVEQQPALETIKEDSEEEVAEETLQHSEEESDQSSEIDELYSTTIETNMPSLSEFLGLASKLLPEFDGSSQNLQSFVDALNILETIKGEFESTAVEIIKSKLKGNIRNKITNENTIQQIINKLKSSVKGESVDVITAKILNVKQQNKTATNFVKEIDDLTKSLENAYISDGLTTELATQYATNIAVKTLAKNANNEKVKLVMESGNFNNMNEAISKFINTSNDTGNVSQASVFYMNKNQNYQTNRYRGRGRNYYNQNRQTYNRGGYNNFRGNNNYRYNNRNNNFRRNDNNNYYQFNRQSNENNNRNVRQVQGNARVLQRVQLEENPQ